MTLICTKSIQIGVKFQQDFSSIIHETEYLLSDNNVQNLTVRNFPKLFLCAQEHMLRYHS